MRAGRPIVSLSVSDLERLLDDHRRELTKLERRRARLQRRLDGVNRKITSLGGGGGSRAGLRRFKNETSLSELIYDILTREASPLTVGQIVERVRVAGYQSHSANFRNVVNLALIKDERFETESRGVYRLKPEAGGTTHRAPRRKALAARRASKDALAEPAA